MNDEKKLDIAEKLIHIENQLEELGASSRHSLRVDNLWNNKQDEINLYELFVLFWANKWLIIGVSFSFVVGALAYAITLPNIYRSEALLAPVEDNSRAGLSGLAGNLGGLASIAGVSLTGKDQDKLSVSIEVLKSRKFLTNFINHYELMVPLLAAEGWDKETDRLIINAHLYNQKEHIWVRKSKGDSKVEPTLQEAYKKIIEIMKVSHDKETNFVVVSVEHYSPRVAKLWVDLLVENINKEIKRRDVEEAEKSIKFLREQLDKTPIAEMQTIFYELIEEQTKTIMFAEVRDEYVFKTIDPAIVPEIKVGPKKVLICAVGLFVGLVMGVFLVWVRHVAYVYKKSQMKI